MKRKNGFSLFRTAHPHSSNPCTDLHSIGAALTQSKSKERLSKTIKSKLSQLVYLMSVFKLLKFHHTSKECIYTWDDHSALSTFKLENRFVFLSIQGPLQEILVPSAI